MAKARKRKIKLCKHEGCKNSQTTGGFCRLHYLRHWRTIKEEQHKSAADRLNKYVARMTKRFPDRVVEEIKKDLKTRAFEDNADDVFGEDDNIASLFSDPESREEIEQLLHDLKVEKHY